MQPSNPHQRNPSSSSTDTDTPNSTPMTQATATIVASALGPAHPAAPSYPPMSLPAALSVGQLPSASLPQPPVPSPVTSALDHAVLPHEHSQHHHAVPSQAVGGMSASLLSSTLHAAQQHQQQSPTAPSIRVDLPPNHYPSASPAVPVGSVIGGADGGLVSACRTLSMVMASGGNTLLTAELERTVLWRSRQNVESSSATWHAASGYLSLLSRDHGEETLRHNLSTFARCVDLLGYRARSFGISHNSAPHLKLIWRPQSASAGAPPGTFSGQETFSPFQTESVPVDVNAPAMIIVHREERALTAARAAQPDTLSYLLPRNMRTWAQPASVPTSAAPVAMGQHVASTPSPMTPLPGQVPQYATAGGSAADNFTPAASAAAVGYSAALSLPPMRGATSALPPMRELANVQHDPQTANMLAYAFQGQQQAKQEALFGDTITQTLMAPSSQPQWTQTSTVHTTATRAPPAASATAGTSRRAKSGSAAQRSCTNCGTKVTRQWVRGERGSWLCHSCGQFWRKNGYQRPAQLWNRPTFKRSRRKRTEGSSSTGSSGRGSTASGGTSAAVAAAAAAAAAAANAAAAGGVGAPSRAASTPPSTQVIYPSTNVSLGAMDQLYRDNCGAGGGAGGGAA